MQTNIFPFVAMLDFVPYKSYPSASVEILLFLSATTFAAS